MFAGNGHGATTTRVAKAPDGPTPGPYHQNGFCLGVVIAIHDGPDADGHDYVDGRHQHTVATCERTEDAAHIVRVLNAFGPMLEALRFIGNDERNLHGLIPEAWDLVQRALSVAEG